MEEKIESLNYLANHLVRNLEILKKRSDTLNLIGNKSITGEMQLTENLIVSILHSKLELKRIFETISNKNIPVINMPMMIFGSLSKASEVLENISKTISIINIYDNDKYLVNNKNNLNFQQHVNNLLTSFKNLGRVNILNCDDDLESSKIKFPKDSPKLIFSGIDKFIDLPYR